MSAPTPPGSDRNLLFGILALQLDFISRDALIAAMTAWTTAKHRPLGDILIEQQALAAERRTLLEALVQEHLKQHGDDPQKSLAAVSSIASVRQDLQRIADGDVQASLVYVSAARAGVEDPYASRASSSVGTPTSSGLRFRILRPHAKGGLGQVYIAVDEELHREVALKEIQGRHADHPESRARFLLEAEVTGGLEHPGIVPVYGLGQYDDGRPFYAMRFIRGDNLQAAIQRFHQAEQPGRDPGERALALRKLLGRFLDVCNAIAYAHSRGVLHRDLKPGNVMLGQYGETLVVDWGLAKPLGTAEPTTATGERPLQPSPGSGSAPTEMGRALGTPSYMSPEQAAGHLDRLGLASDGYSLGATLYHLLTGKAPIEGEDVGVILQRVQRGDFPPPRSVKVDVPVALEAVCLRAMALKPEDRYDSVRALVEDIEHWLADEPVAAHRDSLGQQLARWTRRHRTLTQGGAAALLALAVAASVAVVLVNAERKVADEQRGRAEGLAREKDQLAQTERGLRTEAEKGRTEAETARRTLREQAIRLAASTGEAADFAWTAGKVERARELLDEIPVEFRGWEWRYRKRRFQGSFLTLYGYTAAVMSVAFSPDGKALATGDAGGTVKVWDAGTGKELLTLRGHTAAVWSIAFSPDGWLASAGGDGTVKLWDAQTGKELRTLRGHTDEVRGVAFSPDGQRLASGGWDRTVRVWDAQAGRELAALRGHTAGISGVAFSPDGHRLASASGDRTVKVWDAGTGRELLTLRGHEKSVTNVAFSPDGQWLASVSDDGTVRLWEARRGEEGFWLRDPLVMSLTSLAFSPEGQRLAVGSGNGTVKLWDVQTGKEWNTLRGHVGAVVSVVFSPDGQRLATASEDKTVKVWGIGAGSAHMAHLASVHSVAFSPEGRWLASASKDATVKLWDARTGDLFHTLRGHEESVSAAVFNPDGRWLASGSDDHTVRLWDARTGAELRTLPGHAGRVTGVAVSRDGRRLASGSDDGTVKLWEGQTGKELRTLRGHWGVVRGVAFSPDGRRLASATGNNTVQLWEVDTGKQLLALSGHAKSVTSVAFSPDGRRLASGSDDGTVKLWEGQTGKELRTLRGHRNGVTAVAFTPDGQRLASAGKDGTVQLWEGVTGQHVFTLALYNLDHPVRSVAFSPDGQQLAASDSLGRVWLWYGPRGPEALTLRGHRNWIEGVAFSKDGERLLGWAWGTSLVWDVKTGVLLQNPPGTDWLPGGAVARHPFQPIMAMSVGTSVQLVNVTPPDAVELGHRARMAQLDVSWQGAEGRRHERAGNWFAAAFHWGLLVQHAPSNVYYWEQLQAACAGLRDGRPAMAVCDRLLRRQPTDAPIYFRRARLRANLFQFREATADHLAGLALVARAPIGWPLFARAASAEGSARATKWDWPGACRAFADAAMWERQNPWHRQQLAWAQLAGREKGRFRSACCDLYEHYQTTKDIEEAYRVAAELGPDLAPGPSLLRGLGGCIVDGVLHAAQAGRNDAIVFAACIVPDHGLPAEALVRLARKAVEGKRTGGSLETLGAAQYRAGQFADAVKTLEEAVKRHDKGGTNWMKLFLAMACRKHGQANRAREWFDRAAIPENADWEERLLFERLRQEAADVLKLPPNPKR